MVRLLAAAYVIAVLSVGGCGEPSKPPSTAGGGGVSGADQAPPPPPLVGAQPARSGPTSKDAAPGPPGVTKPETKPPAPSAKDRRETPKQGIASQRDVHYFAVSADGTRLVTHDNGFTSKLNPEKNRKSMLTLWDLTTDKELLTVEDPGVCIALAMSPSAGHVALADQDYGVTLVDLTTRQKRQFDLGKSQARSICFSGDGKKVVYGIQPRRNQGTLVVLDVASGRTQEKELSSVSLTPLEYACSPVEAQLALVRTGLDGEREPVTYRLELYELETLRRKRTITLPGMGRKVVYSSDGSRVAVYSAGQVILFDSATWTKRATVPAKHPRQGDRGIDALAVSPDGRWTATLPNYTGSGRPTVALWTVPSGKMRAVGSYAWRNVSFLPNGVLAFVDMGQGQWHRLMFFDPATGQEVTPPFPELRNVRPKTSAPATRLRRWTSADGKFSVEAEFLKEAGGVVHLRKKDGSEIEVPLDKLSPSDREFLKSQ